MKKIEGFPLKDIIISEDFIRTQPGIRKMERAEYRYKHTGILPARIVINDENVLIDGYLTYLLAVKHKIATVNVYRGGLEIIEAVHGQQGKTFQWRVPLHLSGQIKPGDKVLVKTAKGIKRVHVVKVIWQQYPDQNRVLKRVWKLC